jgi:hypothetical protein
MVLLPQVFFTKTRAGLNTVYAHDTEKKKSWPKNMGEYQEARSRKLDCLISFCHHIQEFNLNVDTTGLESQRMVYKWDEERGKMVEDYPLPPPNRTPIAQHIKIIVYCHWVMLFPMIKRVRILKNLPIRCMADASSLDIQAI